MKKLIYKFKNINLDETLKSDLPFEKMVSFINTLCLDNKKILIKSGVLLVYLAHLGYIDLNLFGPKRVSINQDNELNLYYKKVQYENGEGEQIVYSIEAIKRIIKELKEFTLFSSYYMITNEKITEEDENKLIEMIRSKKYTLYELCIHFKRCPRNIIPRIKKALIVD